MLWGKKIGNHSISCGARRSETIMGQSKSTLNAHLEHASKTGVLALHQMNLDAVSKHVGLSQREWGQRGLVR